MSSPWLIAALRLLPLILILGACGARSARSDRDGAPPQAPLLDTWPAPQLVTHVTLGSTHGCAIKGGALYCWGEVPQGAGSGIFDAPTKISEGPYRSSCGGSFHHCALATSGAVFCSGGNRYGQLGQGDRTPSTRFLQVALPEQATAIDCGWGHTCALLRGGNVYCWGTNGGGQCGVEYPAPALEPGRVVGGAIAIATGGEHSCSLALDGTVSCWGEGRWTQLGYGFEDMRMPPRNVPGLTDVRAISAAGNHTCALRGDAKLLCWGDGGSGQVTPDVQGFVQDPTNPGFSEVLHLDTAPSHSCAHMASGTICWGELFDSNDAERVRVRWIEGLPTVKALTLGVDQSCALTEGGVYCWERNASRAWRMAGL